MARTIGIGNQDFESLRTHGDFYVDKTGFIRDWWLSRDQVTLVCRPRRFGKTLNLDTVRCFLSTDFAGRGEELFGGLTVWEDPTMRALQGTVPVVSLSFADVKAPTPEGMFEGVYDHVVEAIDSHAYLYDWEGLTDNERIRLSAVRPGMSVVTCARAINLLCSLLRRYHGVAPVVLLDEYDAPMQEAWLGGYWDEASDFMRQLMNATFKTNPALGRALITGVTRVSRESIFSDLNNLEICSMLVSKYEADFGFTEEEVLAALDEYGLAEKAQVVREWYDGFTVGSTSGMYNPWSITKYLSSARLDTYWANTSGNGLVSSVVRTGDGDLKRDFEALLDGGTVSKRVDEQVVFSELATRPNAVWGMLVAAGYVKALPPVPEFVREPRRLQITNYETTLAFDDMVAQWFVPAGWAMDGLPKALLAGDADAATNLLTDVCRVCISSFDGGAQPSAESEPERFYHGLVLGLLVQLRGRYTVESNRESGYGRYDVMLVPAAGPGGADPAAVIEFKVFDPKREKALEDTVARAKAQIEDKAYVTSLVERGYAPGQILTYGIAFRGKEVLVG